LKFDNPSIVAEFDKCHPCHKITVERFDSKLFSGNCYKDAADREQAMSQFIARFLRDDEAATAVEYAVILAMIFMTVLAAVNMLGLRTSSMWCDIDTKVTNVTR
jgi:pilus assembly protein Flp/PilA